MGNKIDFDINVYSLKAIMDTIKTYEKVEELDVSFEREENIVKVYFDFAGNPEDISFKKDVVMNEFANHVLGLTKENFLSK